MAVYYKFKSAKDYDSISIDGHFISVGNLKDKIVEKKNLGRGSDYDLLISNAQTDEEYLDEAQLIPKNTSVLVRRVPGRRQMPIIAEVREEKKVSDKPQEVSAAKPAAELPLPRSSKQVEEAEWADEFGVDLYTMPEQLPLQQPAMDKSEEDSKIKAFVDASASDWQRQTQESLSTGRGYGRGSQGRGLGGRGFGRGLEKKTPPQGYICHRCRVPGHFIQHCPTNGDPAYDLKKMKPPTGIPKSMLVANPDGSYALPSGGVAILRPNEAVFEKEIEGLPAKQAVVEIPPEFRCPLCGGVLKDAVLTSKCCFKSYCDKCIRSQILSKGKCVCGAMDILADHLLPNKTLRDAINRLLETTTATSSAEHAGSLQQVQDMESAQRPKVKVPSPSASGSHKNVIVTLSASKEPAGGGVQSSQQSPSKITSSKRLESVEQTAESMSKQEHVSQGEFLGSQIAPRIEEEVQQDTVAAKKKKLKNKRPRPVNGEKEMHRRVSAFEYPVDAGLIPYPPNPAPYGTYWSGPQWIVDAFGQPCLNTQFSYMGYGVPGPLDMAYGGMILPEPIGHPAFMPPMASFQREGMDHNPTNFVMGSNIMSQEEFEARKAELRKKKEMDQRVSYREDATDTASGDPGSSKAKRGSHLKSSPASPAEVEVNDEVDRSTYSSHLKGAAKSLSPPRFTRKRRQERKGDGHEVVEKSERFSLDVEKNYILQKGSDTAERSEKKNKPSVFSRISFPDERPKERSKRTVTEKHGDSKDIETDTNTLTGLRNRRPLGLADRLGAERHPSKEDRSRHSIRAVNKSKILDEADGTDEDVHEHNFKRKTTFSATSHEMQSRAVKRRQS